MESPDETTSLISAGKVQGTPVYNTDGESLGELYDVMIDKRSGRIAYALMSFGGFLGIGERYHPLPWNL
jgi:sporulation protein YlmC with PRC-barrel domain